MNRSTNLNLYLPESSDYIAVSQLDYNFETIDEAVGSTNSKYVYQSKTLGTQTVAGGARAVFNADVAKEGYTLIGIVSIGLANNYMAIGSYTIESTTHAQVVLHNLSSSSAEQTVYAKLLYEKT